MLKNEEWTSDTQVNDLQKEGLSSAWPAESHLRRKGGSRV